MTVYERLSNPSANHRVKTKPDSIQIFPIDGSREAIENFQPIALEAIQNDGDGYDIHGEPHRCNRYAGTLYDMVLLIKKAVGD